MPLSFFCLSPLLPPLSPVPPPQPSPSMPARDLPACVILELLDHIRYDDMRTSPEQSRDLRNISLVCKKWAEGESPNSPLPPAHLTSLLDPSRPASAISTGIAINPAAARSLSKRRKDPASARLGRPPTPRHHQIERPGRRRHPLRTPRAFGLLSPPLRTRPGHNSANLLRHRACLPATASM